MWYGAGMTILEKFVAFTEGLTAERRAAVEEILASLMDSDSPEFALTADELAEIDRRMADPNPERLDHETVMAKVRKQLLCCQASAAPSRRRVNDSKNGFHASIGPGVSASF
jgi:hypothetical protein